VLSRTATLVEVPHRVGANLIFMGTGCWSCLRALALIAFPFELRLVWGFLYGGPRRSPRDAKPWTRSGPEGSSRSGGSGCRGAAGGDRLPPFLPASSGVPATAPVNPVPL